MIDFSKSYTSEWRVFRVNRATWADAEPIDDVDQVDITRTADGSLIESGSMDVTGDLETDYYRVVMTAIQDGEAQRVDVGTLLFDINGGEVNYGTTSQSADGYSVLYPASKTMIITGQYAPAGVNGAAYAAELLRETINAPVEVDGSFTLNDNVVHEIGASVLEAVWAVLDAGGYVIQIDGRGVVHIIPKPTEPALVIDTANAKLLTHGISYSRDISEIPNRYICITGNTKVIAVNDDQNSEVSTVSRGYYVDEIDEKPTPVNGETLNQYARERLQEMSYMTDEHEYTREFAPDVYVYDIVRASIDGLDGDLRVTDQSITCSHGITIDETANREVYMWA